MRPLARMPLLLRIAGLLPLARPSMYYVFFTLYAASGQVPFDFVHCFGSTLYRFTVSR